MSTNEQSYVDEVPVANAKDIHMIAYSDGRFQCTVCNRKVQNCFQLYKMNKDYRPGSLSIKGPPLKVEFKQGPVILEPEVRREGEPAALEVSKPLPPPPAPPLPGVLNVPPLNIKFQKVVKTQEIRYKSAPLIIYINKKNQLVFLKKRRFFTTEYIVDPHPRQGRNYNPTQVGGFVFNKCPRYIPGIMKRVYYGNLSSFKDFRQDESLLEIYKAFLEGLNMKSCSRYTSILLFKLNPLKGFNIKSASHRVGSNPARKHIGGLSPGVNLLFRSPKFNLDFFKAFF